MTLRSFLCAALKTLPACILFLLALLLALGWWQPLFDSVFGDQHRSGAGVAEQPLDVRGPGVSSFSAPGPFSQRGGR